MNSFRCGDCGYVVPDKMVKSYHDHNSAYFQEKNGHFEPIIIRKRIGSFIGHLDEIENSLFKRLKKRNDLIYNYKPMNVLNRIRDDLQISTIAIEDAFVLFRESGGLIKSDNIIIHLLACVYIALNCRREMFPFKEFIRYGKQLTSICSAGTIMKKIMFVRKETGIKLIPNKPQDYFPMIISRVGREINTKDTSLMQIEMESRELLKKFSREDIRSKSPYILAILFVYNAIRNHYGKRVITIKSLSEMFGVPVNSLYDVSTNLFNR